MNKPVPTHNIGSYVPMIDGPEKVSGRAKYTADIVAPGQLAGRIYRSPYSHGEIVKVDVSEALKLPGVSAIVTGADCDKPFGVLPIARSEFRWRATKCAIAASRWPRSPRSTMRPRARRCAASSSPCANCRPITHRKPRWRPTPCNCTTKKPGNVERDVLFELGSDRARLRAGRPGARGQL